MRTIAVVVLGAGRHLPTDAAQDVCLRHCRSPLGQLLHYGNIKGRGTGPEGRAAPRRLLPRLLLGVDGAVPRLRGDERVGDARPGGDRFQREDRSARLDVPAWPAWCSSCWPCSWQPRRGSPTQSCHPCHRIHAHDKHVKSGDADTPSLVNLVGDPSRQIDGFRAGRIGERRRHGARDVRRRARMSVEHCVDA